MIQEYNSIESGHEPNDYREEKAIFEYHFKRNVGQYNEGEWQKTIEYIVNEKSVSIEKVGEWLNELILENLASLYYRDMTTHIEDLIALAENNDIVVDLKSQKVMDTIRDCCTTSHNQPDVLESIIAFAKNHGIEFDLQPSFEERLGEGDTNAVTKIIGLAAKHNMPIDLVTEKLNGLYTKGLSIHLSSGNIPDTADELLIFGDRYGLKADLTSEKKAALVVEGLERVLTGEHLTLNEDREDIIISGFKQFIIQHSIPADLSAAFRIAILHFIENGTLHKIELLTNLAKRAEFDIDLKSFSTLENFQKGLPAIITSNRYNLRSREVEKYISLSKECGFDIDFNTNEVTDACLDVYGKNISKYDTEVPITVEGLNKELASIEKFIKDHNISIDLQPAYIKTMQHYLSHLNYGDPKIIVELATSKDLKPDFTVSFNGALAEGLILFNRARRTDYVVDSLLEEAKKLSIEVDFTPAIKTIFAYYKDKGENGTKKIESIIKSFQKHGIKLHLPE